jgi:enamine deaminase RidA (YjgF/YER057c/UK114 family)
MDIQHIGSTERASKIVKHNHTVYLCGQVASDPSQGIAEQTQSCLDKIDALLEEAGSSKDQMLSVTIYLRDMKDFAALNVVWNEWLTDCNKPARACVEARMARQELLVELTVTAAY